MSREKRKGGRLESGFTFVEMMAVLLIMGVLFSFLLPRYYRSVERARISEGLSTIHAIGQATSRYCARFGILPALEQLDVGQDLRYFNAIEPFGLGCNSYAVSVVRNEENCSSMAGYMECPPAQGLISIDQIGQVRWGGGIPAYLRF
ncbi:MAG: prepilin-type N-terminal cleavage/methylation domain-containing protein [Elusimicrobia bacterium]|nr:prepilin-type N-terminal cleavage/methylation domain-containing protein [Elusimicrobiota bacterium]